MNHYLKRQTSGKRFLAGFLDLVLVLLLTIFVYIPASHFTNAVGWADDYKELYVHGLSSGLYVQNAEGGLDTITDYKSMPKALFDFYVDIELEGKRVRRLAPLLVDGHEFNTEDDYYDVILKRGSPDTLFDFPLFESLIESDENHPAYDVPVLSGKNVEVETFLAEEMEKAYDLFNEYPRVNELILKNYGYIALTILIAYLVSALLLIVLLPLVLKDKTTLGKLITSTIVLDRFGYKITRGRAFARNLSLFLLSFVFFFIPFHLISFLLSMFTKNKESLFDMIAFTIVADKKDTIPFQNVDEEMAHRKRLAQSLLAIEKRKAENRELEIEKKLEKSLDDLQSK